MNGGEGFLEEEEEVLRGNHKLLPFSSSSSSSYSPSSAAAGGPHTRLELMVDSSNNNNNEGGCRVSTAEEIAAIEKEHMFDKVVTPSDVGKLNRLVIPKQHAEKYFPLDSSSNEKGLLLNFEDNTGKPWRFRYSYWNSSQSYVMTKGWSRFVKDKKLDAGDVVSFQRGLGEEAKDRLYIDWRRRPDAPNHHAMFHRGGFGMMPSSPYPHHYPWSPLLMRPPPNSYSSSMPQLNYNMNIHPYRSGGGYGGGGGGFAYGNVVNMNMSNMNPIYYMRSDGLEGMATSSPTYHHQQQQVGVGVNVVEPGMVLESVPVVRVPVAAAGKRLRLFGVNMDCAAAIANRDQLTSDNECEVLSPPSTTNAMTASQPPVEFRLYDDGGATPATTDFFNRAGKTSSTTNTSTTSMSLDFSMSEQ